MGRFFKSIKLFYFRFVRDDLGTTLPFTALALPVMFGLVGLGTDGSMWMAQKRDLQMAADAAVIAAGWEMAQGSEDYMQFAANKEAVNNGYDSTSNGLVTVTNLGQSDDGTSLSVSLQQPAQTFFSRVVYNDPIAINVYSEALVEDTDGEYCILALESLDADAFTSFGSVEVDSPDCGIAVNSSDDEALTLSGNVDIVIGAVRVTGDYDTKGSVDFEYSSIKTNQAPIQDPYAGLEVPEYGACDYTRERVNTSTTLSPGVYCDGLDISGNNDIVLDPGVYIIDGGTFKVTGSGTLSGEGVTIILTGSGNDYAQVDISGSRVVNLKPPVEGDWNGIAFFQDRDAPQNDNNQNKIVGTSEISIDGVLYFPSQGLWFGGNSEFAGSDTPCTRLIARTVTFAGNPNIGNNCDLYDVANFGLPSVRLVK